MVDPEQEEIEAEPVVEVKHVGDEGQKDAEKKAGQVK